MISYPWGVDGTTVRVLEEGSGDRVALLVHGVGARADRWRCNLGALAMAGFHAYAIDLPGHGFSEKGDFDYSVGGYASLALSFLDSIDAGRCVLIGTSLGAHVQAAVTCRQPSRVTALIMVGSLGITPLGEQRCAAVAASLADTSVSGIAAKLARVVHDSSQITTEWVQEESRINSSPGAAGAFAALARYFRDGIDGDVVGDRLAGLAAPPPTLLIWGEQDQIVPLAVGKAAQRLLGGDVPLVTIPVTGHAPYLESPAEFNDAVLSFLRRAGLAGQPPGVDPPTL